MARQKKPPDPPSMPLWLNTYADMITLVLTFFVLLYSMSTIDAEKWRDIVAAFTGNPSIFEYNSDSNLPGSMGFEEPPKLDLSDLVGDSDMWDIVVSDIIGIVGDGPNSGEDSQSGQTPGPNESTPPETSQGKGIFITVDIANDTEILIRCHGDVLFDTGRAEVKPEFEEVIAWIMAKLIIPRVKDESLSMVRIEGHTDERPVTTGPYKDNRRLSTERAASVLDHVLAGFPEIGEEMYATAGYADIRPVNPGGRSDKAQYDINRRVEFVLVRNLDKLPRSGITSVAS